jgi:hypothetical protein
MVNFVDVADVVKTVAVIAVLVLGGLYEIAGETVPGWHTISYSAHRSWLVRGMILGAAVALPIILGIHFAQPILR